MALVKLTENQVARLARRIHIYQRTEAARECAKTIFGDTAAYLTVHYHCEQGSWIPNAVTAYDRDMNEIMPSVNLMIQDGSQDGVKNLSERELQTRIQDWMCEVLIDLLGPFVYMTMHKFDLTIENKLPELWAPEKE